MSDQPTATHSHRGAHSDTAREQLELELLVARCQLGERRGFDALVERFHALLWGYLLGMAGDPAVAEEILQDAWMRVLRGIGGLRRPERLRAWIFSIARRAFMDRLRHRYADAELEPLDAEAVADEPPPRLDWEESEALHRALTVLRPPDRETVVLFYLHELDLREVAEVLRVPAGTVKSRLHRARRLLRDELEAQGVSR